MADSLTLDYLRAFTFDPSCGGINVSPTVQKIRSDGTNGPDVPLTMTSRLLIAQRIYEMV